MAAVAKVGIEVDGRQPKGVARQLKAAFEKSEVAINKLKRAVLRTDAAVQTMSRKAASALGSIEQKAKQAASKIKGMGKAAAIAAAALVALAGPKFAFSQAGELERQTKSLEVLTGSLEKAKGIISELQAFGAVTPFTSQELIETAKRMKAFGFETEKVVGITKRLADAAGATGADLRGIAIAFGQIEAKGRLQGEELLQLQERGIALQDELQKMYGLTGEKFFEAMRKGRIGAESVEVALIRLTEKGGKYANGAIAQSETLLGKLSTLQDAIARVGQNIGKMLAPVFKFLITQVTNLANSINNLFSGIEARRAEIQALKDQGLRGGNLRRATRSPEFRARVQQRLQAQTTIGETPVSEIPQLLGGTIGGTASARSARAAKSRADAIAKARLESEQLLDRLKMQLAIEQEINPIKQIQLKNALEQLEIQQRYGNLIAAEEDGIRRSNLERAGGLALQVANVRQTQDLIEKIKGAGFAMGELLAKQMNVKKEATEIDQVFKGIGDAISTGVVDSLAAAVDGTKALADVASDTLRNLANILLQFGISSLTEGLGESGGILGKLFGGGRASGGTVRAGTSYVVGERGEPELFTPGRSGSIAPISSLGGGANVVVNVDASGSNAQGNSQNARQLGNVIGAAVQAELIKQQRPGGLLAR